MESQETFLSHLIELRQRLVYSLLALLVASFPTLYFSAELYDVLGYHDYERKLDELFSRESAEKQVP